jgi:hypothetical protein
MSVLQLSTGAVLNANINPATARQIVSNGQATVVTPGATGYDTIKLLNATLDTAFQNPPAELLGVDDIYFTPLTYPEPPGGL